MDASLAVVAHTLDPVTRMPREFLYDTEGGTIAEYAILLGFVTVVALAGAKALGAALARNGQLLQYVWPF
ncbi:MAG TPA: hypothetical protein VGD56_20685 [Gemmatirosa sp.]